MHGLLNFFARLGLFLTILGGVAVFAYGIAKEQFPTTTAESFWWMISGSAVLIVIAKLWALRSNGTPLKEYLTTLPAFLRGYTAHPVYGVIGGALGVLAGLYMAFIWEMNPSTYPNALPPAERTIGGLTLACISSGPAALCFAAWMTGEWHLQKK